VANPSLNVWRAKVGEKVRIYVQNLPIEGKAWVERSGAGTKGVFDGNHAGMTEADLLKTVEELAGCSPLAWSEFLDAVESKPKAPRGREQGQMAASRRGGVPTSKSWSTIDALKLDPNVMAHPLTEEVTIIVDDREPAEFVDRLRQVRNLKVEIASLPTGDFLLPGKAIIERKTNVDFAASIIEKRIFTQAERLAVADLRGIILLEGNVYDQDNLSLESITGMLTYLSTLGISLMPTLSIEHSVYTLVTYIKQMTQGLGYEIALRGPKHKGDPMQKAKFVVEGFPGISANLAKVLLDHFGSIVKLSNSSLAELSAVPGIGPARALAIHETLHARE
jgi:ERCC4-type nuclease